MLLSKITRILLFTIFTSTSALAVGSAQCANSFEKIDASTKFVERLPPYWQTIHAKHEVSWEQLANRGGSYLTARYLEHCFLSAAISYYELGEYSKAGYFYRKSGMQFGPEIYAKGAEAYEMAGELLLAAQMYEQVNEYDQALVQYKKLNDTKNMRRIMDRSENLKRLESIALSSHTSPQLGRFYGQTATELNDHFLAARIYERFKLFGESADSYLLANRLREAAGMFEWDQQFYRAALLYVINLDYQLADKAFVSAGMPQKAEIHEKGWHVIAEEYRSARKELALWYASKDKPLLAVQIGNALNEDSIRLQISQVLSTRGFKEIAANFLAYRGSQEAAPLFREIGEWRQLAEDYFWHYSGDRKTRYKLAGDAYAGGGYEKDAYELYMMAGEWSKATTLARRSGNIYAEALAIHKDPNLTTNYHLFKLAADEFKHSHKLQEATWAERASGNEQSATKIENALVGALKWDRIVNIDLLGGGKTPTYLIQLRSGISAVFKPRMITKYGSADNEVAVSFVDRLFGFDFVPLTIIRKIKGLSGSLQYFVADARLGRESRFGVGGSTDLKYFDYLLQIEGRHPNNYLILDGKIIAIDNAAAFGLEINAIDNIDIEMGDTTPVSPEFIAKLKNVSQEKARAQLSKVLTKNQVNAFLKRRLEIINKFELD